MAREISRSFKAPMVASTITRLLVDLNRSVGHPDLYSNASRHVSSEERDRMLHSHYLPYRMRVGNLIAKAVRRGHRVIHISSHSFTPRLDGVLRRADIGLLYDPARPGERKLGELWKGKLRRAAPDLRVRRNYPYLGKHDGLTSHLRRRYAPEVYVGVELELNQALVVGAKRRWTRVRATVVDSLRRAIASEQWQE